MRADGELATYSRIRPREAGPITIAALVFAMGLLWIVARPHGASTPSYIGQFLGAESVLLLSIGLVLISTLPLVEEWFDGIDRAAIWHRRVAITGLLLLAPHVPLVVEPARHRARRAAGRDRRARPGRRWRSWAILPRWQSVVPRPLRGLVLAARDAPLVRDAALASSAATSAGGRCTARPASSSRPASSTACSTARRSPSAPFSAGATSPSAQSGSASTSTGSCSPAISLSLHDYQVAAVQRDRRGPDRDRAAPARAAARVRAGPVRDGLHRSARTAGTGTRSRSRAPRTRTSCA